MSARSRAALLGVVTAGAYVVSALASGSMSILARRPLLDGFQPVVYRWVNPPAALAHSNQMPASVDEVIDLSKPERGAGFHGTTDRQAELVFDPGTFPAKLGRLKLRLKIEPLDPATISASLSAGLSIAGNAYRFDLRTTDGRPGPSFAVPAHLVLLYPQPMVFVQRHTVLHLEGSRWVEVKTTDAPAQQQAAADVRTAGTYAVAASAPSPSPTPSPRGAGGSTAIVVGVVGAVVAVAAGALALRARREAARRGRRAARRRAERRKGKPSRRR